MLIINKDSYFKFSAGEVHVKHTIGDDFSHENIYMKDYSMDGLMALAEYVDILRRNGVKTIEVTYPYLPYSRQDRVIQGDEPFSLKLFANAINSLHADNVFTFDCHSDVALALINNIVNIPQDVIAKKILPSKFFAYEHFVFVSPDAGAYKKTSKLIKDDNKIAIGLKKRGEKGEILNTKVLSPVSLKDKACVIVDDICDGGRTFIELAKALREQGAAHVFLYVTHGIFSKGLSILYEAGIEHIYTTDSFPQLVDSGLTVLRTEDAYNKTA